MPSISSLSSLSQFSPLWPRFKKKKSQLGILLADLLVECGIHCFHLEKQPPWYAAAGLPADAGAGVAKNALCSFLHVGPQVHGMPSLAFLICVSLKQGTSAAQPWFQFQMEQLLAEASFLWRSRAFLSQATSIPTRAAELTGGILHEQGEGLKYVSSIMWNRLRLRCNL